MPKPTSRDDLPGDIARWDRCLARATSLLLAKGWDRQSKGFPKARRRLTKRLLSKGLR